MPSRTNRRRVAGLFAWVCVTLIAAVPAWSQPAATQPTTAPALSARAVKIGFGSCCRQDNPAPIWDAINAAGLDTFIFLGDNIYADTTDPAVFRAKYTKLGAVPGFVELNRKTRVLATWDDHDYGGNDVGAEFPAKKASREIFLDFWRVPADSPRRAREGIYDAVNLGPESERVQVILLDVRWFRSLPTLNPDPKKNPREGGPYIPSDDPAKTVLGEAQWKWLEEQLRAPARVRIIASGSEVVCDTGGNESWGLYPHERKRLIELVRTTGANGVVFISGDRHFAEVSRTDEGPYTLYDVTSSSLNAPRGGPGQPAPWRVGKSYNEVNFGVIEIDWSQADPAVALRVRGVKGDVVIEQKVKLSELAGRK